MSEKFQTMEFGFKTDQAGLNYINPNLMTEESDI